MNVVVVGGIHGVGKSTACKLVSAELGIPFYTASQIVRGEKPSAIPTDSKLVADVAENQRLLLQGISKLDPLKTILLDGHFTVQRKADGQIEAIQEEVFRELRTRAIVVLVDTPTAIAARLRARDNTATSPEALQAQQEAEVSNAKHIAAALGVPILVSKASDTNGIVSVIRDWGI
jgi:adenylate kinase